MIKPALLAAIGLVLSMDAALAQSPAGALLAAPQRAIVAIAPAAGAPHLSVRFDHPDGIYQTGQALSLSVSADRDAFFTVIGVDAKGGAVQLYPNAMQPAAKIPAGTILAVPGQPAAALISVGKTPGIELIRVVATSSPRPVVTPDHLVGNHPFKPIEGGATTAAAALRAISGRGTGFFDQVIQTVAADQPAAGAAPTLPVFTGQAQPNPIDAPAAASGAAVLIATDRPVYGSGDHITMAVTVLKPCFLWVIDVSQSGSANLLFPNKFVRQNQVAGPATVLISGGTSPVALIAHPPAGRDLIFALCGNDPAPPAIGKLDFSQMFPPIAAATAVSRDIQVVAAQPKLIPNAAFAGFDWTLTSLNTD